jgi:hypothetical protein
MPLRIQRARVLVMLSAFYIEALLASEARAAEVWQSWMPTTLTTKPPRFRGLQEAVCAARPSWYARTDLREPMYSTPQPSERNPPPLPNWAMSARLSAKGARGATLERASTCISPKLETVPRTRPRFG